MRKLAFLTGLILASVCLLAAADDQVREAERNATFTVALNGSDSNPGTFEKPFATIERARDEVRKLVAAGLKEDLTVFIRGGTYHLARAVVFGMADSGTKEHRITYAAYPGETPVFSGGVKITGWRRLKDSAALPPAARGKVWVTDIPDTRGGKWRFHALFDGGELLPRAISDGFKPLPGFVRKTRDFWIMPFATPEQKSVLRFPKGALRNWPNLDDVEIRIFPWGGFTINLLVLRSVDEEKGEAITTLPASYPMTPVSLYLNPLTPEDAPLLKKSAWVENVLEALDEPGEWVLNTHEGRLYLWPRGDSPGENIEAPRLVELIRVEGQVDAEGPADTPVRNLVFRGLTFTHADRDVWSASDAGIQHDWEMYDKSTALMRFRATEHCLVDECRFTASGGTGVRFDLHSQYNCVQRSLFDHLGQSGVLICGYGPGTKDVSFRNEVINNHIHDLGEIYWHSHGIIVWQSSENLVAHNLIHDMPRKAIMCAGPRPNHFDPQFKDNRECSRLIRWGEVGGAQGFNYVVPFLHVRNNVIEENVVYRVLGKGADGAAINMTGIGEGNIIRRNILHDVRNARADAVIRLDGSAQAVLISENVIYDCAIPAISPGYNQVNFVENNIMVDLSNRRRPEGTCYFTFGERCGGRFQRNIVYSSSNVVKFLLHGPSLGRFDADFNIFYSAGNPAGSAAFVEELKKQASAQGDAVVIRHQRTVSTDPMFVDPAKKDFRLRPDSPAWKLGFKAIDTSSIGLTADFPARYR
jgi:hypothetical protein